LLPKENRDFDGTPFVQVRLHTNLVSFLINYYYVRFLEKCGHEGLNDMLVGFEDKSAYAQTIVAYCPSPGGKIQTFVGRTDGKIVRPRGSLEFGWDPIFEPTQGFSKTYAEMTKEEKDSISHRSRAFAFFQSYLKDIK
jgi:inosine triphosphate pyrophosphatase